MRAHHRRAIDRVVEKYGNEKEFVAIVVAGSVAKGRDQESSDVDVILIATDEEYQLRRNRDGLQFVDREVCDYAGGYVDFKTYDVPFLREVAEKGSETARAAFKDAFVAWSSDPSVEAILASIPVYPVSQKPERIAAFYAQLFIARWYLGEGHKRSEQYLVSWAATNLVLFGGRLILAHNEILFPYHKWFMHELTQAPSKPADLVPLSQKLLMCPCMACGDAYYEAIDEFRDWGFTHAFCVNHFLQDTELTWLTGRQPPEYW